MKSKKIPKKPLILLLLITVIFVFCTGCLQSERSRVLNAAVNMLCVTKNMTEAMSDINTADAAMQELSNMDSEMNTILKKYGFESMEEFENISKEYEKDENFENDKQQRALNKCGFEF